MRFTKDVFYRLLACVCACLLCAAPAALAVTPADYSVANPADLQAGHLYGESCILIDANTGDVLFEKDADSRRYPASTTKIMTCILAIEQGPVGEMVTIPAFAMPDGSSKLGILPGEVMSFTDLLYGMMLASGNDAALAVASLVAGSETEFVKRMNQKALELGCTHTHFTNSHGYHEVNHYTTARDLAAIAQYAMKDELFQKIVAAQSYVMSGTNFHDGAEIVTKYDLLLPDKALYYAPCIGVKTGYTNAAGRCFVGAARQNFAELVSVSLNTSKDDKVYSQTFTDTIRMFKYGFLQYQPLTFHEIYALCDDNLLSFKVEKALKTDANNGYLRLSIADIPAEYQEWYLKRDVENVTFQSQLVESFTGRLNFTFAGPLTAPISQGQVVGTAEYTTPSGQVLTGQLVASRDVEMEPPTMDELLDQWVEANAKWMFKWMPRHNPPIRAFYWALLAAGAGLICLRVYKVRKRNQERRRLLERKRREYIRRQKQREAYLKAHPEARRAATKTPRRKP